MRGIPSIHYLTAAQVLFIHDRLIAETGGSAGVRDLGLLAAAVARPQATFDGADLYPDLFTKAAAFMASLVNNHPFVDGNKRTARIISNAILFENGHCPLSFRTVDAIDYKKAMLIFYEQNNLQPMKEIFIDQYAFAVRTYF